MEKSTEFKCRFAELTTFSNCPKAPVTLDFGPKYNRTGKRAIIKNQFAKLDDDKKRSEVLNHRSKPDVDAALAQTLQQSTHQSTDKEGR